MYTLIQMAVYNLRNNQSLQICSKCKRPCDEEHEDVDTDSSEETNSNDEVDEDEVDEDEVDDDEDSYCSSEDSDYNSDHFTEDLSDDEDEDEDSMSLEEIDEEELEGLGQDLLEEVLELGYDYRVF